MSERPAVSGKINFGVNGLGVPTPEMVEERARAFAKTDGRAEPNENDRVLARQELLGVVEPQTPEVSPEVEKITEWDEPAAATGSHIEACLPEDEATVDEVLVEEGLDEAEYDLRKSAAEENPPEEG